MLLHDVFRATVRRVADKTALVTAGRRLSYAEVDRQADALATTLQRNGVRCGDRVVLFAINGPEAVITLYATLRAGAAIVPLPPQTHPGRLRDVLADVRPSCLVTTAELAPVWGEALRDVDAAPVVIVTGDRPPADGASPRRVIPFADAVSGQDLPTEPGTIDQDLAAILYTSGVTGEPKGVMLSHLNMRSAAESVASFLGVGEHDVILCAHSLALDYGLYQILMAFDVGATVVLEPSFAYLGRILGLIERERVTILPGVPTLFARLSELASIRSFDLLSVRLVTSTGAPLAENLIAELRSIFPRARLFSMYGLTECKRVSYLPPDDLDRRPTSVGRGMPNEELWLVDEHGRRLPPGSVGELVVRGSHVMRGYWGRPEETAERLRPGPLPGETVLHTGDIFRMDESGYLYYMGRSDGAPGTRGVERQ